MQKMIRGQKRGGTVFDKAPKSCRRKRKKNWDVLLKRYEKGKKATKII